MQTCNPPSAYPRVCRSAAALVLAWNLPWALAAPADKDPEASDALQEIVVTAEKRESSLQDTPISIVAFGAETLESRRIASVADLGAAVPNVQVTPHPNTGTTVRVTIRGIGEPSAVQTRDNPVAVYIDGVYVGRGQGLANELADLERIEVLRGPQGTLYGRNATAGAINFITKAPELAEFGGQQSFTFGRFNQFNSRTSVNFPVGDTLAFDLGYLVVRKDGFVDNLGAGADRFGDVDRKAARAAAFWKPTDAFQARYTFDSTWLYDTSPYVAAVPFYPAEGTRPTSGSAGSTPLRPGTGRVQGHNLTFEYEAAPRLKVRTITGYRKVDDDTNQAYNPGPVRPFLPLYNRATTDQSQFSEEVQFIGDAFEGGLEYVAGLYYFRESGDGLNQTTLPFQTEPRAFSWKNKAYAVFGQATWTPNILDKRLHATLGARWSKDEREAGVFARVIPVVGTPVVAIDASGNQDFDDVSPTGTLQFDINDDVNVFARIAKGYKTGGFNPTASSAAAFARGFGPETLISYEAGVRSELFGRRVRFNATAFYSDYDDIQTNVFNPLNTRIFDVVNAGKATVQGVEVDVTALLVEGLTVNGSFGYTDPEFKKVVDLGGNDITSSFEFPHAPKSSFTLGADYKSPGTRIGTVEANLNYEWQGKYFGVTTYSPPLIAQSYGLLNGRVALADFAGVKGLQIAAWGRNLTDSTYYLNHFAFVDVGVAMFGEPRSYGVDVSMKFGSRR